MVRNISRPVVTLILDGYGIAPPGPGNAVSLAKQPRINQSIEEAKNNNLYLEIGASSEYVGLPSNTMGNSECGHLTYGAGNINPQGLVLLNSSMESGEFYKTDNWLSIIKQLNDHQSTLHLFGLLSDGNVHSSMQHVFNLLDAAKASNVKRIRVHPLIDGRDVPPLSGLTYIKRLEDKLKSLNMDAIIASGGGRMSSIMDRYESDWKIVQRGFQAIVHGYVNPDQQTEDYNGYFCDSTTAINRARELFPEKRDQFNPVWVIVDDNNEPVGKVNDNDVVINWNFRGDRALQISRTFDEVNFDKFDRNIPNKMPKCKYAGLLEYDGDAHIPLTYCCSPPSVLNTIGEYTASLGLSTYAIAETHKYGHVTFFWNGSRTGKFNDKLETYVCVQSEPNEMIPTNPKMKNKEVTDELCKAILDDKHDLYRCNFACPDMVGHTGIINAVVTALESTDSDVGRVLDAVKSVNGFCIISADHGNSEVMLDKKGEVVTSHTTSKVPFWIYDPLYDGSYVLSDEGCELPGIANYAATCLDLAGVKICENWRKSFVVKK